MATHHYHHHYASTHHHHHHFTSTRHPSSTHSAPLTKENRGKFLAVNIFSSILIISAATAFLVLAYTQFAAYNGFPKFLIIPFTIVPVLMMVIALVSLIRGIVIYRKAGSMQNEESHVDEEGDSFDSEIE